MPGFDTISQDIYASESPFQEVQSPPSMNEPFSDVQSPPPTYNDRPSPSKVHLPTAMRAVKDAEKSKPQSRTIVLCLDGTGDKFDNDNSNIVHFVSCLKKDDKSQVTYYQSGIGTYGQNGLSYGVTAALDMAVGSGLGLHVRDAYHFLMHSYKEGDKICILGFSRGAYTARCLAGMVHKVGLLPPRNLAQIPFAYDFYKDDTPEGWKQSAEFKETFCIDVSIYFLGVFDSVASVGFIPRQLPLSSTPTSKSHYFRHAMALDERRSKFKICRYQSKDASEILKDTTTELGAPVPVPKKVEEEEEKETKDLVRVNTSPRIPRKPKKWQSQDHEETEFERQMRHAEPYETDVLEVWFAGCHADVGGGAVPNDERHRLSQIPLRWMIRQCFECDTGIIFKTRALANVGLDVHTLWPRYRNLGVPSIGPPPHIMERYEEGLPPRHHRSTRLVPIDGTHRGDGLYHLKIFGEDEEEAHKTGEWLPEQIEDYFDAFAPANDQLLVAKGWWILEVWPVEYKIQAVNSDAWESKFGMNLGMYRCVEGPKPNLHWTVQHLIAERGYKIQARSERNAHWNIVA